MNVTMLIYILIILVINFVFIILNLLISRNKPDKDKKDVFECGYHSFRNQNRTPVIISYFIFGLLFLLFDLEVILLFPYATSCYNNELYGLFIVVVFIIVLILGFIFEIGKKALTISSKQNISIYFNKILELKKPF